MLTPLVDDRNYPGAPQGREGGETKTIVGWEEAIMKTLEAAGFRAKWLRDMDHEQEWGEVEELGEQRQEESDQEGGKGL